MRTVQNLRDFVTVERLVDLIKCQHEDEQLDFKESYDPTEGNVELIKDIMAFANSNGGHIVFGVRENKDAKIFEAVGLPESIALDDLQLHRDAEKYLSQAPTFQVAHHVLEGRRFSIVYIASAPVPISTIREGQKPTPDGKSKKVFDRGIAYERVSSENRPVNDFTTFWGRFLSKAEPTTSPRAHGSANLSPVGIKDSLFLAYDTVDSAFARTTTQHQFLTGFQDLDQGMLGLMPGNVLLVVGRPLIGKSLFATNICLHATSESPVSVAYFCLSSSLSEAGLRFLSAHSGVHIDRLRRGHLGSPDWLKLSHALGKLAAMNINIVSSPGITASAILETARTMSKESGLDLVLVDDVQALGWSVGTHALPESSFATLKMLALELKIPVLAIYQLPSRSEARTDDRPTLGDVGGIADTSDVVIALHRPQSDLLHLDEASIEVHLLKNRYGPVFSRPFFLIESTFYDQYSAPQARLLTCVYRVLVQHDPASLLTSGVSPMEYREEAREIAAKIGETLPDLIRLASIVSESFVPQFDRPLPKDEAMKIAELIASEWNRLGY